MPEPTLGDMITAARRRAVVVAHCDDESLFAAGLMLRHPGDWTVLACSIPRADPIRAWKFFDACHEFDVRGRLLPFEEPANGGSMRGLDALDLSGFDLVVTHNAAGEYGHHHHRQVHEAVAGQRSGRPLLMFGFRDGAERGAFRLDLSTLECGAKMAAIERYDHVAPHDGGKPKWRALLDRYQPLGWSPSAESFDLVAS